MTAESEPPPYARSSRSGVATAGRAVATLRSVPQPGLRLICFPHVGAGAAAFRPWLAHLPSGVELYAVRPPGRENRVAEPLYVDGRVLLDELGPQLEPLLDVPFVLVGHCSGSVLAYEYARQLVSGGGPCPVEAVFCSAEGPSQRVIEDPPLHRLASVELLERVIGYGGMSPEILEDADLTAMYERILRADYSIVETLEYSLGPPLPIPMTVLGGRHDRFVFPEAMLSWSAETSKELTLRLLDARHYMLVEAGTEIGRIARRLTDTAVGA